MDTLPPKKPSNRGKHLPKRKKREPQTPRMALSSEISWLCRNLLAAGGNLTPSARLRYPIGDIKDATDELDSEGRKLLNSFFERATDLANKANALGKELQEFNRNKKSFLIFDD